MRSPVGRFGGRGQLRWLVSLRRASGAQRFPGPALTVKYDAGDFVATLDYPDMACCDFLNSDAFVSLNEQAVTLSPGEPRSVDSSEIVAKVDDAVITVSDVEARINTQTAFGRSRYADPARRRQLVDELVQNEALAAEAARHGYDKDPDVQRAVKQQMVAKLVQKDFDSKLKAEDVPEADGVAPVEPDHLGVGGRSPVLPG